MVLSGISKEHRDFSDRNNEGNEGETRWLRQKLELKINIRGLISVSKTQSIYRQQVATISVPYIQMYGTDMVDFHNLRDSNALRLLVMALRHFEWVNMLHSEHEYS